MPATEYPRDGGFQALALRLDTAVQQVLGPANPNPHPNPNPNAKPNPNPDPNPSPSPNPDPNKVLGPAAALPVPAFEQSRRLQKRLPPAGECTEEALPMPAVRSANRTLTLSLSLSLSLTLTLIVTLTRSGLQAARLDAAQAER